MVVVLVERGGRARPYHPCPKRPFRCPQLPFISLSLNISVSVLFHFYYFDQKSKYIIREISNQREKHEESRAYVLEYEEAIEVVRVCVRGRNG